MTPRTHVVGRREPNSSDLDTGRPRPTSTSPTYKIKKSNLKLSAGDYKMAQQVKAAATKSDA